MSIRKTLVVLALLGPLTVAYAAERGQTRLELGGKAVSVDYGRPSLAGRDMLGQAQPGMEWRLGADSPTALKSEADLSFGTLVVAKGSYVLRARRDTGDKWTLLVAPPAGAPFEVPLTTGKLEKSVETLEVELIKTPAGGRFEIRWGTALLSAEFAAK